MRFDACALRTFAGKQQDDFGVPFRNNGERVDQKLVPLDRVETRHAADDLIVVFQIELGSAAASTGIQLSEIDSVHHDLTMTPACQTKAKSLQVLALRHVDDGVGELRNGPLARYIEATSGERGSIVANAVKSTHSSTAGSR